MNQRRERTVHYFACKEIDAATPVHLVTAVPLAIVAEFDLPFPIAWGVAISRDDMTFDWILKNHPIHVN
jgi:hypothetical protein